MNELVLVKQAEFDGVALDCYIEATQTDKGDFWATREQIGQLLGYQNAEISIANIHNRNRDRLDKFSTLTKLIRVEGGRKVEREVTLYSFKGLLEICRYSHKPRADAVMDWLFDVADEIRRTGSYSLRKKQPQFTQQAHSKNLLKSAEQIVRKAFACKTKADFLEVLALDNVFKEVYGKSALDIAHFRLKSDDFDNLEFEFTHPELEGLKNRKSSCGNCTATLRISTWRRKCVMQEDITNRCYYTKGEVSAADFIDAYGLNFNRGNIIKYVTRAGKKQGEDAITALLKAQWYLGREIIRVGHEQAKLEQLLSKAERRTKHDSRTTN